MARFHRSRNGRIEPCRATVKACPLGEANHFENQHEAMLAASGLVAARPVVSLVAREQSLFDAATTETVAFPVAHRNIAAVREVFFNENGLESGHGVVVTRLRDGNSHVRLPILHEREPGQWVNVQLRVRPGQTAEAAFKRFLDGVEYEPPSSYKIIGSEDGCEVLATLSTEHYARLRAALRASERVLEEPLPEEPRSKNGELLKELLGERVA